MRARPTLFAKERRISANAVVGDSQADLSERKGQGTVKKRFRGIWRFAVKSVFIPLVLIWGMPSVAQQPQKVEYQVKGAFLVKFAMFVEWPAGTFPDARAPITIGILGDDPFGSEFETALKREVANGRPFSLKRSQTPQELTDCQILFVSASESQRVPEILDAMRNKPVLTVGDHEQFAHRGGMINFIKEGGKVRFEVNTAAIEASGLKISVKLMQVAKPVTPDVVKGKP